MRLSMTIAISLGLLLLAMGCDRAPVAPDSVGGSDAAAAATMPASDTLDTTSGSRAQRGGGPLPRPVVYVVSQGLFYDSIVTADPLPMKGRFQKLEMGPNGLQTQFGPGDTGYLGGRWWEDTNGNGQMEEGDHFFLCPLLGPGRESP